MDNLLECQKCSFVSTGFVQDCSYLIQRLLCVLNSAVRLISMSRKADHVMPLLIELHWLPVEQHINFKILLFTYKTSLWSRTNIPK